jgi:hypothetical protein
MKALSVRQPHAEAILRGIKKIEYRKQPTNIRERIYIYAGLGRYGDEDERKMLAAYGIMDVSSDDLSRGVLVGTVELVNCTAGESRWYEWHLCKPERLEEPLKPVHRANPVWFHPFDDSEPSKPETKKVVRRSIRRRHARKQTATLPKRIPPVQAAIPEREQWNHESQLEQLPIAERIQRSLAMATKWILAAQGTMWTCYNAAIRKIVGDDNELLFHFFRWLGICVVAAVVGIVSFRFCR